ncbi:MAG: putative hydro-lyase [Rhodospirillaceae bacterium]
MDLKASLRSASPAEVRALIRKGQFTEDTSGLCGGYLQGNLVILPQADGMDFFQFCQRNPKPCPLIGVSDPGDPMLRALGQDIDVRSDLPGYKIFRDGVLVEEASDITAHWRDDLMAFLLGCSFSFEEALSAEGIEVRHVAKGRNVPMYRTNIPAVSAGRFRGEIVVSMRPFTKADAIRAIAISGRFPEAHGTPIHFGDPSEIGITDLDQPDFGDGPELRDGEIPVFWACGVTPQVAIANAKPAISITHMPGKMLITSIRTGDLGRVVPTPTLSSP